MLKRIVLILGLVVLLCGCSSSFSETSDRIIPPKGNTTPLEGKWSIFRCLDKNFMELSDEKTCEWLGEYGEFSKQGAMLGKNLWVDVTYKTKKVKAEDFFLYNYGTTQPPLGISTKEIYVVTVTSKDKFLYEFIKVDDHMVIVAIQGNILFLKKLSDTVDGDFHKKLADKSSNAGSNASTNEKFNHSGVLLGIRSQKKSPSEGIEEYTYKTIWIACSKKVLHPIYETEDIFLPRVNGFWNVEMKRESGGGISEDLLTVYKANHNDKEKSIPLKMEPSMGVNKEGNLIKKILYIGNDYISMEVKGDGRYKSSGMVWSENRLKIIPVDNISNVNGMKITDLVGETGKNAIRKAKDSLKNEMGLGLVKDLNQGIEEENIALSRKNGHWFMSSRFNYERNYTPYYHDFNLNILPPPKVVWYDVLKVSWKSIKDRVPRAIDAFTSPWKDIVIVITNDRICVYTIEGGELSEKPLERIKLLDGDAVVMAEWATDDYVDSWEKTFLKNKVRRVEGMSN